MAGAGTGVREQQSGTAGINDSNRFNRGQLVQLASNMDKDEITMGAVRLTQVVSEEPQSVVFLVDSYDRENGTSFNFNVNMQSNLFRCRKLTISRCILPKLHNITPMNNTFQFQYERKLQAVPVLLNLLSPPVNVTLTIGYYDATTICNEISARMNAAVLALEALNPTGDIVPPIFVCSFDGRTNTFNISMIPAVQAGPLIGTLTKWWLITNSGGFLTRGRNFMPFPITFPFINIPALDGFHYIGLHPAAQTNYQSGLAGLTYTRYVTLHSSALHQYSYAESRTSSTYIPGKIIAILNTVGSLVDATKFAGVFHPAEYPNAPLISILNPQRQLQKFLDFQVRDEFGFLLDNIFPNDPMGFSFWMSISF